MINIIFNRTIDFQKRSRLQKHSSSSSPEHLEWFDLYWANWTIFSHLDGSHSLKDWVYFPSDSQKWTRLMLSMYDFHISFHPSYAWQTIRYLSTSRSLSVDEWSQFQFDLRTQNLHMFAQSSGLNTTNKCSSLASLKLEWQTWPNWLNIAQWFPLKLHHWILDWVSFLKAKEKSSSWTCLHCFFFFFLPVQFRNFVPFPQTEILGFLWFFPFFR